MNINFKINREEESVLVSNQHGILETREYQDNVEDILKLEDVIEDLEIDLMDKKQDQMSKMRELEQIIQVMPKVKKEDILSWCFNLFFVPVVPLILTLVYIINVSFTFAWLIFIMATVFCGSFGLRAFTSVFWPFRYRECKREKQELEESIQNLNLNISCLEQVLAKNKTQCQKLLEEKTKNKIQNACTAIQTVSYKEELELQKKYLEQMLEENKLTKEPIKQRSMILRRIRKFKKGN